MGNGQETLVLARRIGIEVHVDEGTPNTIGQTADEVDDDRTGASRAGDLLGERTGFAEKNHVMGSDLFQIGILNQPRFTIVLADRGLTGLAGVEIDARAGHSGTNQGLTQADAVYGRRTDQRNPRATLDLSARAAHQRPPCCRPTARRRPAAGTARA